mmetsp:Transcript_9418/g.19565  ORF Transcript_9418/g.19565 Transcript_9418/m.19565 type:complete len:427 (+) Transcript_9418:115-1395(+)
MEMTRVLFGGNCLPTTLLTRKRPRLLHSSTLLSHYQFTQNLDPSISSRYDWRRRFSRWCSTRQKRVQWVTAKSRKYFRKACRINPRNPWTTCTKSRNQEWIRLAMANFTATTNGPKQKGNQRQEPTSLPNTGIDIDDDDIRWRNWLDHWWVQLQTVPNRITMARIASTPVLVYWIVTDQSAFALAGCTVAAFSDFMDGWIAKRYNMASVLGTYMDPLADKILINSLSVAIWYSGTLPTPIMAVWMAKDVALTVATYQYVINLPDRNATTAQNDNTHEGTNQESKGQDPKETIRPGKIVSSASARMAFLEKMDPLTIPLKVEPTQTSKVNTALQFLVLGMAIVHPLHNLDPYLFWLSWTTAGTTTLSLFSYVGYRGLKESGNPRSLDDMDEEANGSTLSRMKQSVVRRMKSVVPKNMQNPQQSNKPK